MRLSYFRRIVQTAWLSGSTRVIRVIPAGFARGVLPWVLPWNRVNRSPISRAVPMMLLSTGKRAHSGST